MLDLDILRKVNDDELETIRKGFYQFKESFMNNKKFYDYDDTEIGIYTILAVISEETMKRVTKR